MLYDVVNLDGTDYYLNPADEFSILVSLHKDQNVFTYQEGLKTYLVTMEDYTWLPEKESMTDGFQGTFVAELREITG
jgi:3'-phosphoadenosine 5'-phosphosulfate (PAPS) 3'-phosphatase